MHFHFLEIFISALINHCYQMISIALSCSPICQVYVPLPLLSIFSRIKSSSSIILFIIFTLIFPLGFPGTLGRSLLKSPNSSYSVGVGTEDNTIVAISCISFFWSIGLISSAIFPVRIFLFFHLSFPVFM